VERLDFSLDHYGGQIAPDPDGEYVSYSDFAALAAKQAEAEEHVLQRTQVFKSKNCRRHSAG